MLAQVVKKSTFKDKARPVMKNEAKSMDLKFALYIAAHSAVGSIDHLGESLQVMEKENLLDN